MNMEWVRSRLTLSAPVLCQQYLISILTDWEQIKLEMGCPISPEQLASARPTAEENPEAPYKKVKGLWLISGGRE